VAVISLREVGGLFTADITAEQFDDWVEPQDMTHPLER
jgi:hypothetical protein